MPSGAIYLDTTVFAATHENHELHGYTGTSGPWLHPPSVVRSVLPHPASSALTKAGPHSASVRRRLIFFYAERCGIVRAN